METLGASYVKFFTCKQRENERVVWCSREIAPSRSETRFLGYQKRVGDGFSLSLSFQRKGIHPISAAASAQADAEVEEIQTIDSDKLKTIQVRFKLQKECSFGQQFLIVGDDPILGLWDPSDAMPLNWSEGHVWTADIDIPSGKVINYKFILKGNIGTISWQPGPDRILETWDTEKTITVFEDWDNPELQNIVEGELVADPPEDSSISSDSSIVAENLTQPNTESLINSGSSTLAENLNQPISDKEIHVLEELANDNGHINPAEKPSAPMIAGNITEKFEKQGSSVEGSGLMTVTDQKNKEMTWGNDDGLVLNGSNLLSSEDKTRLVSAEGVPVLVPGLIPIPMEEIEKAELNLVENNGVGNTAVEYDGIGDSKPEIKDEHVSAPLHYSAETSEMRRIDEKQQLQLYGEEELENNIFKSNMQWGRRTLQKFLASFGFQ